MTAQAAQEPSESLGVARPAPEAVSGPQRLHGTPQEAFGSKPTAWRPLVDHLTDLTGQAVADAGASPEVALRFATTWGREIVPWLLDELDPPVSAGQGG